MKIKNMIYILIAIFLGSFLLGWINSIFNGGEVKDPNIPKEEIFHTADLVKFDVNLLTQYIQERDFTSLKNMVALESKSYDQLMTDLNYQYDEFVVLNNYGTDFADVEIFNADDYFAKKKTLYRDKYKFKINVSTGKITDYTVEKNQY